MAEILHNLPGTGTTACAPTADTRGNILALSGTYEPGCWYGVTDATVGSLAAAGAVTIWMIALNTTELSVGGHAEQGFDGTLWPVEYDIIGDGLDRVEHPQQGHDVRGAGAATTFPWGDVNVNGVTIEPSGLLTFTPASGFTISGLTIGQSSVVDTTGAGGVSGQIIASRVEDSSVLDVSNTPLVFIAGVEMHSAAFQGASAISVTCSQTVLDSSSIVAVGNGTINMTATRMGEQAVVAVTGPGLPTLNVADCHFGSRTTINLDGSGGINPALTIERTTIASDGTLNITPDAAGSTVTISQCALATGAILTVANNEAPGFTGCEFGETASFLLSANVGSIQLTGNTVKTQAVVAIQNNGNPGGTISVNGCTFASFNILVDQNATDLLTLLNEVYDGAQSVQIDLNNVANLQLENNRVTAQGLFTITNNSGTTLAAARNLIAQLSSVLWDSNTGSSQNLADNRVDQSALTVSNNQSNGLDLHQNTISDGGVVTISTNTGAANPLIVERSQVSGGSGLSFLTNAAPLLIQDCAIRTSGSAICSAKTGFLINGFQMVRCAVEAQATVASASADANDIVLLDTTLRNNALLQTLAQVNDLNLTQCDLSAEARLDSLGANHNQLVLAGRIVLGDGGFGTNDVYGLGTFTQTLTANNVATARDYFNNSLV